MIGIDIGFGFTKVAKDRAEVGKFPTWIAYYDSSMESVEPIEFEGSRSYVVGEYASYSKQRIDLADVNLLITFMPLIVEYAKRGYSFDGEVVSGLSPKHYALYKENAKFRERLSFLKRVVLVIDRWTYACSEAKRRFKTGAKPKGVFACASWGTYAKTGNSFE
ncbi:hypothetical protein [Hydrogenobacter hydrogenophilus]|uniref:Actin-like protein N-terminal domain-containing protein n=1 Tax=Hydrogenobacter hydrogenophilus TaxID=35835 RepID=A0A285P5R8_9AQUI|nr:hypothetical protein [Hydrogenobacter hydrogenophilus]SNZ15496.1 hypothetical protein SAMN06265353_1384 [Hydrogenobacter hydrogenophilus]